MDKTKLLMSLGSAIVASRVAKTITGIGMEDVLGTVGLARRRSHALENIGLVAVGALVGAGTALLLAPASGRQTRQRIGQEASRLGHAATEALREQKDEAFRTISQVANGAVTSTC